MLAYKVSFGIMNIRPLKFHGSNPKTAHLAPKKTPLISAGSPHRSLQQRWQPLLPQQAFGVGGMEKKDHLWRGKVVWKTATATSNSWRES